MRESESFLTPKNYLLAAVLILSLFLSGTAFSQATLKWAARYNEANGRDYVIAMKTDNAGNTYVTGQAEIAPMTNDFDAFTIKYDANGNELWKKKFNGTGNFRDGGQAIDVDNAGNVYAGIYSNRAWGDYDIVIIKYDMNGNIVWQAVYNSMHEQITGLKLDNTGNIYVCGSTSTDPWNSASYNYLTLKYDNSGNLLWAVTYNGTGNAEDQAQALAVDNAGNVFVTGYSAGAGTGRDYATVKYDASGVQQWVQRFTGPGANNDYARDVEADNSGNVYVTGSAVYGGNNDFITIKHDNNGNVLWAMQYNGPANGEDNARALKTDNTGCVIVTGESQGAGTGYDYATIKYDAGGMQLWLNRFNGATNEDDGAAGITTDNDADVYITGWSKVSGTENILTVKYNSAGVQQWFASYDNPGVSGPDIPAAIDIDQYENVYTGGYSTGAGTDFDCVTLKYSQDENTRVFCSLTKIYAPGNNTGVFGYKFDHDENIPIGADNKFMPAPEDRGQPTVFTAGIHNDVFEVLYSSPITWHLKSGSVTTEAEALEKYLFCEVNDFRSTMPGLNQETEYEIKYKKTGGAADVFTDAELYSTIPDGTEFVSATGSAKMTAAGLTGNTFKWTRADPIGTANEEDVVKIRVKVTDATKPNYTNTAVLKTKCGGTNYHSYGSDVNAAPPPFSNLWVPYNTGVPYSLFAVDFYRNDLIPSGNEMVGLAVGQGGTVLRTTDAGDEWTLVYQNINIWLNDVKWATADVAYAAGMGGVIIKTTDAGVTWNVIREYDTPMHTFRGIGVSQAYDYNFVTFVGYAGTYFETHDAGLTFTQRTDVTPWTMHSIDFTYVTGINESNGIIAGTDGYVWNTTNHGVNWVVRPELRNSGVYDYLNDVVFASKDIAFICGNNGRIVWTTNHGVTWAVKPSFTSQHLRSIDMVKTGPPAYENRTVTVCGDNGTVYTSTDWCNTWSNGSPSGETRHFYGVCLNGEYRGTVVGEIGTGAGNTGMMYNSISNGFVGILQAGTEVPAEFKLNQNFPNPFNPMTKIKFSIAKQGPVMLSVFDITGREVTKLVNAVLPAGNFEYTFDGLKLASGVYFYRLVTNDFVQTKKMVLVK